MESHAAAQQPIVLPDDMQDWADANRPMISRLSAALHEKPDLGEKAIWGLIAGEYSPEWSHAKSTLNSAEAFLRHVHAPENMPLGLIGKALHSEETNAAKRELALALAGFTIIDEQLRQEVALDRLLRAAVQCQQALGQSLNISRGAADVTAAFAAVAPAPEVSFAPEGFARSAAKKIPLRMQGGMLTLSFQNTKGLTSRTASALRRAQKLQPQPAG